MKFWDVKTVEEVAWSEGPNFLEGLSVAEAIAKLNEALDLVPDEFKEAAFFVVENDSDWDRRIELTYVRPKNAEELASDEKARLATYQAELDRTRRNYEDAQRAFVEATKNPTQ
jgi:phytoene dehydrogenase-like protein